VVRRGTFVEVLVNIEVIREGGEESTICGGTSGQKRTKLKVDVEDSGYS
jgi:hypothetical protein